MSHQAHHSPSTHRALQLEVLGYDFKVRELPIPEAIPGSAVIRIEQVALISYHGEIYNGERGYRLPTPIVGGCSCIGRVSALGIDSTLLKPGQLVFVDCVFRSRDNPDDLFLSVVSDGSTDGSRKLCREVWRDGSFAEYFRAPLENCIPLDEARLRQLGYSDSELAYMAYLLVPFGGLRDINLEPGETVIVSPATGGFGGAGVQVAIAMGARVVAMGRNQAELARLKAHVKRGNPDAFIETVPITGDHKAETAAIRALGAIDAVLDFSPREASSSTHLKSAMTALRRGGRVSIMGMVGPSFPIDGPSFLHRNLMLKAKHVYERGDVLQFVKLLERGRFPRGGAFAHVQTFPMQEWKEALDAAAANTGIGKLVTMAPWSN